MRVTTRDIFSSTFVRMGNACVSGYECIHINVLPTEARRGRQVAQRWSYWEVNAGSLEEQ